MKLESLPLEQTMSFRCKNRILQIAESQSGTLVATLDSKKLSLSIDAHALILHQNMEGTRESQGTRIAEPVKREPTPSKFVY